MRSHDFPAERKAMVEDQLRSRGIASGRVLDAMERVPREAFIDADDHKRAYHDMPLAIGFGQTISQPYMVALIAQTADVRDDDKMLDVGTGSGYAAAVLAELGADVHTIERIPELAAKARRRLDEAGYENVTVHTGDGSLGLPAEAPFDAITVAAAAPELPMTLYEQLVPGGRLVVPIGTQQAQRLEVAIRSPEGPAVLRSVPCRFVPLVGARGYRQIR
jgi:protein-L-isoaspartate(D-aspartate) O-methyltransferase